MAQILSRLVRQAITVLQKRLQASGKCKVLLSTIMCIRYPFLYPRNRFTGYYYNNWTILKWMTKYYKENTHNIPETYRYKWNHWWNCAIYNTVQWIHNNLLQWLHCIPTFTELNDLPKTWQLDWGIEWCEDLREFLKNNNVLYSYRISQIKEKWGEFDWLFPPIGAESIESKYIERSKQICINCGKPATKVTQGWISYVCDDCAKNYRFVEDIQK